MDQTYLILGYGVPADIFSDPEYRTYLASAFNRIFEHAHSAKNVRVIFCGGKTDMVPPYRRSEAGEMRKYFSSLMRRDSVRRETGRWKLRADAASLSTLENLLNARKLMEKEGIGGRPTVFCEFTRRRRIARLARLIYGGAEIVPVDFSLSANRYLGAQYLREKEKNAIAFDLWALKSAENFQKYHRNFVEKFAFLRSYGPERRQEAIRLWWENEKDLELREGVLKERRGPTDGGPDRRSGKKKKRQP